MIEREFIRNKIRNLRIRGKIIEVVGKGAGCGKIDIEKTPLGEKIIVDTLRPGLVIGRGGTTIKKLTSELKSRYGLENPQIEVREVLKPNLVAAIVARRIADEMERFGPQRFKSMGYRSLNNIMKEGAMGAEIVISGRGIPSQRSKTWRFYKGYLKKCGDIAVSKIDKAIERANLRSGAVGIVVKIMLPGTELPDRIIISEPVKVQELKEEPVELKEEVKKTVAEKPTEIKEVKKASAEKVLVKTTPTKKADKIVAKKIVTKPVKKVAKKVPAQKPAAEKSKSTTKKKVTKKEAKA